MRERRVVETLTGRGWIALDNVRLGEVTYSIDVWQQFVSTGDGEALPGTRQVTGRIAGYAVNTVPLFDRVMRLHLENGGHWDCFLEGDRLKAAGALLKRDRQEGQA